MDQKFLTGFESIPPFWLDAFPMADITFFVRLFINFLVSLFYSFFNLASSFNVLFDYFDKILTKGSFWSVDFFLHKILLLVFDLNRAVIAFYVFSLFTSSIFNTSFLFFLFGKLIRSSKASLEELFFFRQSIGRKLVIKIIKLHPISAYRTAVWVSKAVYLCAGLYKLCHRDSLSTSSCWGE